MANIFPWICPSNKFQNYYMIFPILEFCIQKSQLINQHFKITFSKWSLKGGYMKAHRMYAIILRNAYFFRHSLDRWTDAFWWPTIDIITWGLTSVYFQSHANNFPPIVWYIMSGIVLWIVVYRSQYEINVGFLDDIWN